MAPSKQPLFLPSPPTTLDDFFGKSETSNSRQSASSQIQKRVETRRPQHRPKTKRVPPPEPDIIVIDSDEDTPLSCTTKRKAEDDSGCSSDVEIVEVEAITQRTHADRAPSSGKKAKVESGQKPDDFDTQGTRDRDLFTPSQDDVSESDKPQLFRPAEDGVPKFIEGQNFQAARTIPSDNQPRVAAPAPLALETYNSPRPLSEIQGDSSGVLPTSSSRADSDNVIEIDDEWGTGDDELVQANGFEVDGALELTDDEVEAILKPKDESPATSEETTDQCPFCGITLTSLSTPDMQSHTTTCCDSFSTIAPSPTPPFSSHSSPTPPPPSEGKGSVACNAFSVLMSSHKENNAWKEAEAVEDRSFRPTKANGGRRKAPFYKVMQGMPIAVDAFRYGEIPGVTSYFLTHAHSDHYTNLSSSWKAGPIYCSEGTANLIIHMLSVDPKWVHPLPMNVPTLVPRSGSVTVTLIEANHCPGSSLFLFEGAQTVNAGDSTYKSSHVGSGRIFRYLHCGDFRASPQHTLHQAVKGKRIDIIYLDTTYLNPRYLFPAQAQVISACAELAKRLVSGLGLASEDNKGSVSNWVTFAPKPEAKRDIKLTDTLVVVGTYSIGKERIVKAIAKALQTKVYCDSRKAAILRCQSDPELHEMLTTDPFSANVHLVPLGVTTSDRLKEYIGRWKGHWAKAIAFRPTGWTYSPPAGTSTAPSVASILARPPHREFTYTHLRPARGSTSTAQFFGVPYSEHSSFFELTCFALSVDWARIVATVNVESANSRAKISAWIARWEAERKKRPPGVVPHRTLEYW